MLSDPCGERVAFRTDQLWRDDADDVAVISSCTAKTSSSSDHNALSQMWLPVVASMS
jgi:hypothetical protein